jgi:hypothetical protein
MVLYISKYEYDIDNGYYSHSFNSTLITRSMESCMSANLQLDPIGGMDVTRHKMLLQGVAIGV